MVAANQRPQRRRLPAALLLVVAFTTCWPAPSSSAATHFSGRFEPRPARRSGGEETMCKASLDLHAFSKLNGICDDCFALFKEPEVYQLCRSDCFGSSYFVECVETLYVRDELKSEVASYLQYIHDGHSYTAK